MSDNPHSIAQPKVDPAMRPDNTPDDNNRIEIGPMRLRVELVPRTGPTIAQPVAPTPPAHTGQDSSSAPNDRSGTSAIDDDAIASWLTDTGNGNVEHDTEILPNRPEIRLKKKYRSIAEEGDEIIRRYLEMVGQRHPDERDADV